MRNMKRAYCSQKDGASRRVKLILCLMDFLRNMQTSPLSPMRSFHLKAGRSLTFPNVDECR